MKKRVVFQVHHLYYLPQFLPVAEKLLEEGDFEVYFSPVKLKEKEDYDLIVQVLEGMGYPIISGKTEKERVKNLLAGNFDVTVFGKAAHAEDYCTPRTIAVLLYHGIGFKSCYYTDFSPRLDVRYVESEYRLNELLKYNYPIEYVLTGFPKLDWIQKVDSEKIKSNLGINTHRPTILYAPTFYPSSLEIISEYLAEVTQDYNLIVKLHHFSFLLPKYRHQVRLWEKLARKYNHVRLLPVEEYNIVPYFRVSDLLISDGSSTAFEFLSVDKPVVRVLCQKLRWHHRILKSYFLKRMDLKIESELSFMYQVDSSEKLSDIIEAALMDKDHKKELFPYFKQKFLGEVDGKASERVVADLKKRLGL